MTVAIPISSTDGYGSQVLENENTSLPVSQRNRQGGYVIS